MQINPIILVKLHVPRMTNVGHIHFLIFIVITNSELILFVFEHHDVSIRIVVCSLSRERKCVKSRNGDLKGSSGSVHSLSNVDRNIGISDNFIGIGIG